MRSLRVGALYRPSRRRGVAPSLFRLAALLSTLEVILVSLVGFCGSRYLPASQAPRLAGVVSSVLASRRPLAVGCCVGVDAAVIRQAMRAGSASRLSVFCAFGPLSPAFLVRRAPRITAPGASSSVSSVSGVAAALAAGASVSPWSGGGPAVPLVGRLAGRSAALVSAVAASSGPGCGLVAFVSSKCPPHLRPSRSPAVAFSGHGSGSWGSLALAVGLSLPVVVFPFDPFGYGAGPALPSSWGGVWVLVERPGWVGGFRFVSDSPTLV